MKSELVRACPGCHSNSSRYQRDMVAPLYECGDCGTVFASRVPDERALQEVYEKLYSDVGGAYRPHRIEVEVMRRAHEAGKPVKIGWERRWLFSKIKAMEGGRLLDVGAGTGYFLYAAKMKGFDVVGVELSDMAIDLGVAVHGIPVKRGRIEDLDVPNGAFDVVTAWEVLEHLVDPLATLKSVSRMLRPNGVFAGSIPNYERPRYRFGANLGRTSVPPVHLNFWGPGPFRNMLEKAGFADVRVYVPRIVTDLLRPFRSMNAGRVIRFVKVAMSRDLPTTMAFVARRP